MVGKVVAKTGVKRESGYLYFIDKNGNVARAPMKRGNNKAKGKIQVVNKAGIKRNKGCMYFLDKAGNVCEVSMNRKGGKKKKASELAKPTVKYIVYAVEKKVGSKVVRSHRAKKVVLASKVRALKVSKPSQFKTAYGVRLDYEAKVGKTYKKANKVVSLTKPAVEVRVVNDVPKKYK